MSRKFDLTSLQLFVAVCECLNDPHLKASGGPVPMQVDEGSNTDVVLLPLLTGGRRPGVPPARRRRRAYSASIESS